MKLKASHSTVGKNKVHDVSIEDRLKKDGMMLNQTTKDKALSVAQDWQNEKNLEVGTMGDNFTKRSKASKNSRVGSRDGSRRGKRHRKIASSVHSKRERGNRSKVGQKRVLHNSKNLVIFNEFKNEEKIHKEIGILDRNGTQNKSELFDADIESIEFDESKLNEAISYQYSLGDRSDSFDEKDKSILDNKDNIGEENFVEIAKQDSFEKLEVYKDKWP